LLYICTKSIIMNQNYNSVKLFLLAAVFLFPLLTFAAHFRGGKIEYQRASGSSTVNFKVYSVWDQNFVDAVVINFGDGSSQTLTGTEILLQNGFKVILATVSHTYANPVGNYIASYTSCCRISNTQNSADQTFIISSNVCFSSSNLNSPESTSPFIFEFAQGITNSIQLPGSDADGSSVNFSMVAIQGSSYVPTIGGNTLSVSTSGALTWNTTGTTVGQLYQLKVKLSDGCAETELDVLIKIVTSTCPTPLGIIAGNATINSGQSTNLTLNFTGAAPWNYSVSNVGSGTTSSNPLVIAVSPIVTTTYTINSVSNGCGVGNTSGNAKVVVCNASIPSTAAISGNATIGTAQSAFLSLDFTGNGPWTYDINSGAITGTSTTSQKIITVSPIINTTYTLTSTSDVCGAGTTSGSATVTICQSPTAVISGTQAITAGQIANISVAFTGAAPWTYNISNFGTGTTTLNPLTIGVNPSVTTTYSLISVSNSCSLANSISGSAVISVCGATNIVSMSNPLPISEGQSTNLVLTSSTIPFNYTIPGVGSGVANTSPFSIPISPLVTTNYVLTAASNACGAVTLIGNATVVVESPNSNKKLISCFPFDGSVIDQKGTNSSINNGAVLTTDRNGKVNSAYFFNGTSYISMSSNELLNSEFTYSAWIRPSSLPVTGEFQSIFSIGGAAGDQLIGLNNSYFANTDNRAKIGTGGYAGFNINGPNILIEDTITVGKWYYVTAVRTIDTLKFFLNGVMKMKLPSSGLSPYYASNSVVIGARYNGGQGFKGTIDELKLFKGALSPEEIKVLYATQTCNFEHIEKHKVELVSCYNFTGNAQDGTNTNNGIINNLTLTSDRLGNPNSAYLYTGSGDISVPTNSFSTNNYSISLWVKPSSVVVNSTLISFGSASFNQSISIINNASTGNIPSFIFSSSLSTGIITVGYSTVNINQWYHITAIKDPSRIRLFINGQLVAEKGIVNNATSNYGAAPYFTSIGSLNGLNKFQGIIDDVKIFNGGLYEDEVKDIFQKTSNDCNFSPCPTYKLVTTNNLASSKQRASILLEGINTNATSSIIEYNAGNSVTLKPGFNSNTGGVFKAEIKGCYNPPSGVGQATVLTLQPGPLNSQDGEISSITPNTVYSNGFFLDPLAWTQSGDLNVKRTFIKFDISSIPPNAIIDSAFLSLYFSQALVTANPIFNGHYGDNELSIQRVNSAWTLPTLTWNTQPTSTPINQLIVPAATSITQNYLNLNVKNLVDDMKNNGNYGFMIKHSIENVYKITCLTSSEETNPLIRPKLVVYYH
jgi:Concanavalin A-like lectin/glucanases superfamily